MPHESPNEATPTVNSREPTQESRNEPQTSDEYDPLHALRGLSPGARITVHRQTPAFAKGFLDHLTVPQAGEIDIESEIKTNWGGGTYKLQPRQLSSNGRMNFGKGCVILSIAGEPTLNGRRYINGILEEPSAAVPVAQPFVMQNPQASPRDGLEGQLLTMVQQTLARAGAPNGTGVDLAGLGTLITSMSGIMGPKSQSNDSMGEMDRAFTLLSKMQKLSGLGDQRDSGGGRSDDDSSDGLLGGSLGQMLMAKLMGSQTPQQPQYPPQPPPQYPYPRQPTPHYQTPPPPRYPPDRPNWPAPPPGVPFQGSPDAQRPPQTASRPPQAAPPDPQTMDGPFEGESVGDAEEPFTVANLQAELEDMSPEQREQFMAEFMRKVGIDEKMGRMFSGAIQMGPTNGTPVQPQQETPTEAPEVFPAAPPFAMSSQFDRES